MHSVLACLPLASTEQTSFFPSLFSASSLSRPSVWSATKGYQELTIFGNQLWGNFFVSLEAPAHLIGGCVENRWCCSRIVAHADGSIVQTVVEYVIAGYGMPCKVKTGVVDLQRRTG